MSEEELEWLLDIATPTGISYSGDQTITIDFANKVINYINKQKEVLDKIEEYLNKVELGELENGKAYTFKDFLKEEKDAEIEEAKWLLELLEEIE